MSIIEVIIVFVIGYVIGKIHAYYTLVKLLREAAEEAGIDLNRDLLGIEDEDEVLEKAIHMLKIDKGGDILYLFDKDTDEFICQGSTIEELATRAKEYKQILLASVLFNDKTFMFVNGTSQEYNE